MLIATSALLPSLSSAQKLSPEQRRSLHRGEIITRTLRVTKTRGRGEAIGVIDAPPARVFSVIADVAHYKEFMTRVTESKVIKREGNTYDFAYTIDMPWPLADYHCVTHNVHKVYAKHQRYERRWKLVSGTFTKNEGYWRLGPWPGGKTLVTYSVVVQPKTAVPDFIVNFVAKKALPRAIKSIRKRLAQLALLRSD
ncbi:MAG: SRPBCC family protein [Deltaproteobacteria bacterium]|nr:SRPBCC family protein [Deltaproteobacteria bacterium]